MVRRQTDRNPYAVSVVNAISLVTTGITTSKKRKPPKKKRGKKKTFTSHNHFLAIKRPLALFPCHPSPVVIPSLSDLMSLFPSPMRRTLPFLHP